MTFLVFYKSVTDRRTDGRMDGRTDQWTDGWMDGRMDGPIDKVAYSDACTRLKIFLIVLFAISLPKSIYIFFCHQIPLFLCTFCCTQSIGHLA